MPKTLKDTGFITILGRYDLSNPKVCGRCSVLEQHSNKGFLPNLITAFRKFGLGLRKIPHLHRQKGKS
jgi:hypothetical protein